MRGTRLQQSIGTTRRRNGDAMQRSSLSGPSTSGLIQNDSGLRAVTFRYPHRRTAAVAHAMRSRTARALRPGTAGVPACEPVSPIHFSSCERSRAVCQRSSGSLARLPRIAWSRAGGVKGLERGDRHRLHFKNDRSRAYETKGRLTNDSSGFATAEADILQSRTSRRRSNRPFWAASLSGTGPTHGRIGRSR